MAGNVVTWAVPVAAVDSVVVPFTHKLESPVIAGVVGNAFTVTTKFEATDSQLFVSVTV